MSHQPSHEPPGAGLGEAARLGEQAWTALATHGLAPTPHAFTLLFTHFAGQSRALSQRLDALIAGAAPLTDDAVEHLYEAFLADDLGADAVDAGAEAIVVAAQSLVGHVASGRDALATYGHALATCAERIAAQPTVEDLRRAVAAMSVETGQAAARNRALEEQLAAASARIAKLRQNLVEVRQEATTDPLTGLANRKAFDTRLRRALAQAKADPAEAFCLAMLDVDHFKRFNDTHGHQTGDQVLRLVGQLLSDNVKGRDTAARYGGEEFAVILVGADQRAATNVIDQICRRVRAQQLVKRRSGDVIGQITLSAGVAQHRPGESGGSLVQRADRALYDAKRAGRDRVRAAIEVEAAA